MLASIHRFLNEIREEAQTDILSFRDADDRIADLAENPVRLFLPVRQLFPPVIAGMDASKQQSGQHAAEEETCERLHGFLAIRLAEVERAEEFVEALNGRIGEDNNVVQVATATPAAREVHQITTLKRRRSEVIGCWMRTVLACQLLLCPLIGRDARAVLRILADHLHAFEDGWQELF